VEQWGLLAARQSTSRLHQAVNSKKEEEIAKCLTRNELSKKNPEARVNQRVSPTQQEKKEEFVGGKSKHDKLNCKKILPPRPDTKNT